MMVKLRPVVNFANILQADFFVQKCFVQLFTFHSLALYFFWQKHIGVKGLRKMLVKSTAGGTQLHNIKSLGSSVLHDCRM